MKRALKWIVGILVGILGLVLLGVVTLWLKPELILNGSNLARLQPLLSERGIEVTWDEADVSVEKPRLNHRDIQIRFTALKVAIPESKFSTEIKQARGTVGVGIKGLSPYWKVALLDADVRKVALDLRGPKPNDKSEAEGGGQFSLPSGLHGGKLRVDVDDFTVHGADFKIAGAGGVAGQLQRESMDITTSGHMNESRTGDWRWKGMGSWIIEGDSPFSFEVSHRAKKYSFQTRLKGKAGASGLHTEIIAKVDLMIPGIKEMRTDRCRVDIDLKDPKLTKAGTDCAVIVRATGSNKAGGRYIPSEIKVQAKAKAEIKQQGKQRPLDGEVSLVIAPATAPLYVGSGEIKARVGGDMADFPTGAKWETEIDLALEVKEFQKLVDLTFQTSAAVPRPLSVMRGPLMLRLKGKADMEAKGFRVPIAVTADLRSPGQRLWTEADGSLKGNWSAPRPSAHLELDVLFREVRLVAPPIDVMNPVKPLPDGRFERKVAGKTKPSGMDFQYDVRLRSEPAKALFVAINRPKADVPIELDMKLSSKDKLKGKISLQPFTVTLFRQKAKVESFSLSTVEKSNLMRVSGKVSVEHGIHKIYLSFFGTEKSMNIDFSATPPLSKDQIIALLLFGRTPDSLAPDEADSVGNLRSAVAEGAINLFTLYTLASTPIQSINYQAATGVVTTGVRVEDGTVILLGSDMKDQYRVGLQKRLGSHWWWTSDWKNSGTIDSESPVVSSFIEWVTRY